MKLCMVGAGYVGLVTGVCFSDIGNTVICLDNNKKKINDLNNGKIPIYEPGLDKIVERCRGKNLSFSTEIKEKISFKFLTL